MKVRKSLKVILQISLIVVTGCATSSQVTFYSNPSQANVYAHSLGQGKKVFLGQTPVSISSKKLNADPNLSSPLMVQFSKDGFESKSMLITEPNISNLLLSVELNPSFANADQATLSWIVESSFEVQRLVKVQRYDEALSLLNDMNKVAPYISSTQELYGGIYYLKGQTQAAYDAYSKALKLNPKSAEAARMVAILRGNSREVASVPPAPAPAKTLAPLKALEKPK